MLFTAYYVRITDILSKVAATRQTQSNFALRGVFNCVGKREKFVKKKQGLSKCALAFAALIWGAGFSFSQMALDAGFGVSALLVGKFGTAAVLSGIVFHRAIREQMSWRLLRKVVPVGIVLIFSFYAQTYGLQLSTPSNCAFITAAYVVITPLLWRIVFRKKPPRSAYLASVVCFVGVVTLSVELTGGISFRVGDIFTLVCAVLFAVQIVASEALVEGIDFRVLMFVQFATAAVVAIAMFFITERDFSAILTVKGFGSIAYLGVGSTFLCYNIQTAAQRYVNSNTAALILSLEALFGVIFAVIIGYDAPSLKLFLGGGLILLPIILPELVHVLRHNKSSETQSSNATP